MCLPNYVDSPSSFLDHTNFTKQATPVTERALAILHTRILFLNGPALDTSMDVRSKSRVSTFSPVVDFLKTECVRRVKARSKIHERFGFLLDRNLEYLGNDLI